MKRFCGPKRPSRRCALQWIALLCVHVVTFGPVIAHSENCVLTLREAGDRLGLLIGAAVEPARLEIDPIYRAIVEREYNSLTPENVLQWNETQPTRTEWDFEEMDKLAAFAEANGQELIGHALLSSKNKLHPTYVKAAATPRELLELMCEHITGVMKKYPQIRIWHVLNEPFKRNGKLRNGQLLRMLGPLYIREAFRCAHEANPNALLSLNDFFVEGENKKADALYELTKSLLDQGVPIHGVGFQGHMIGWRYPGADSIARNLSRFTALGLYVHFTEVDVQIRKVKGGRTKQLRRQAKVFYDIAKVCRKTARCIGISTWNVTDADSWIRRYRLKNDHPLLFGMGGEVKPAFPAVIRGLGFQHCALP